MADIVTPGTARKTEEFTTSQIELVRNSLAIADNPILADRTYIVFDATSGNNNLHLGVGASGSYAINKGEGGLPINYTDTGGVKVLNYTNAGRYLITISGNFHGIDTNGELQSDKDQYISIVGGTNYVPTTLTVNAFQNCTKLEFFEVKTLTVLGDSVFSGCVLLKMVYLPLITGIGNNAFDGCIDLQEIDLSNITSISSSSIFRNCKSLKQINLESASSSLGLFCFSGCENLEKIYTPLITGLSGNSFDGCTKLKSVSFPLAINVNSQSFINCINLKSAHFPIVTALSTSSVFSNCNSLESVNFDSQLGFIGQFDNLSELKNISIDSATSIQQFSNLTSLKELHLPSITSIAISTFTGCINLEKITLKGGVTIGVEAFLGIVLTDIHVIGTEAQALAIETAIVAAGGLFSGSSRLIFGSKNTAQRKGIIQSKSSVGLVDRDTISTTFANTGESINIIPILKTSKLHITLSTNVRLFAGQDGLTCQFNYSLDNGSTYNQIIISTLVFTSVAGVGLSWYSPIHRTIIIDSPAITDNCIFDLQFKAFTGAAGIARLEGSKQIVLKVNEIIE